jgi:hypothetical protein
LKAIILCVDITKEQKHSGGTEDCVGGDPNFESQKEIYF